MPLIEVLPSAKGKATPGWAYVADTGFDPSKQAIVPSGARDRKQTTHYITSTATAADASDQLSAREQAKITKHLAELDRENHKDVVVTIPNRPKEPAQRSLRGVVTPGVKKILLSAKTWRNFLDDEEAALSQQKPVALSKQASTMDNIINLDEELQTTEQSDNLADSATIDPQIEVLLKSDLPTMPSRAAIEVLLAAPPLSYNAARAAPSTSSAPPRQFCEICGYWGRARCMKCNARICGLECKRQHEDTRCLKFYA